MSNINKKKYIAAALGIPPEEYLKNPSLQPLNKKILVKLEDIHLSFPTHYYLQQTIRDKFISIINNPLQYLIQNTDLNYILQGINFNLYEGDRIGIIGVNGCGKTSLCRIIAQKLFPTAGTVNIYGRVQSIFNTASGINNYLTGRENIHLLTHLFYRNQSNEEKVRIYNNACDFCELKEALDQPFMYYSKGMQTRLFLSVITSLGHDILILDEIFDGADEFFRKKIQKKLENTIFKSKGFIFVSHSFEQIERLCNRCIVLHEGKIIFDGELQSAYKLYQKLSPALQT